MAKDLKPGMKLPGIVTNVAAFGAFVDIGLRRMDWFTSANWRTDL